MRFKADAQHPISDSTEQLRRELAAVEDKLIVRINGDLATIAARLDSYDKATELFDANLHRIPTETQQAVSVLKELQNAQIQRIEEALLANAILLDEKFRRTDEEKATAHATLNAEISRSEAVATERIAALQAIVVAKVLAASETAIQTELSVERRFETVNAEIARVEDFSKERILAITNIINAKADAGQAAILLANTATEKRFEAMAEFQQSITNANNSFATRAITDGIKEQLSALGALAASRESVDAIKAIAAANAAHIANIDGKMFAYAGVAGLIATILAAFFSVIGHITSLNAITPAVAK